MFSPESYTIVSALFPRLLGFIYFFAFGAFLFQIKGLIGKEGILPVSDYLKLLHSYYPKTCYHIAPTVFWLNSSDKALMGVIGLGTLISIGLIAGFFPPLLLFLCYVLYLSIVSAGQDFLSFGWEGYLLEITAHAFLLSMTPIPNFTVWISMNVLLFRFHFQAGAVKLQSKDSSWKNLTAIAFHYLTQPIPNTIAWYAYKLPMWFQKISCLLMFAIELIVPFGIFLTAPIRLGVFFAFFFLQYGIWVTGNFSFLNHLTVVFSTILIDNKYLTSFFAEPAIMETPFELNIVLSICGGVLLLLQIYRLWYHFLPGETFGRLLRWLAPFHLANRYGIFAIMTVKRYEIVVEGSDDKIHWKEYTFRWKPSELNRRPRRISPYQPRLDWQAWFLPFDTFENERWFQNFIYHLLKGSKPVLKLLRGNPFPHKPPKFVRALAYDYEFSDFEAKRKKGEWWKRKYVAPYCPILSLKETIENN